MHLSSSGAWQLEHLSIPALSCLFRNQWLTPTTSPTMFGFFTSLATTPALTSYVDHATLAFPHN